MAENKPSLFQRLQRLFSTDVIIRNVGGNQLKVIDTDKILLSPNLEFSHENSVELISDLFSVAIDDIDEEEE